MTVINKLKVKNIYVAFAGIIFTVFLVLFSLFIVIQGENSFSVLEIISKPEQPPVSFANGKPVTFKEEVFSFPKLTWLPKGKSFVFPEVTQSANPKRVMFAVGEQLTFVRTTEDTFGNYIVVDAIIPPGGGPPPHIHHRSDEWFYFIDEGFTFFRGSEFHTEGSPIPGIDAPKESVCGVNANPGTLLYGPRNQIHTFKNSGISPARVRFVLNPPADLDKWFIASGLPITDPSKPPAFDPSKLALAMSLAPQYGLSISTRFDEYVDSVSPFSDEMIKDNHADELISILSDNDIK